MYVYLLIELNLGSFSPIKTLMYYPIKVMTNSSAHSPYLLLKRLKCRAMLSITVL